MQPDDEHIITLNETVLLCHKNSGIRKLNYTLFVTKIKRILRLFLTIRSFLLSQYHNGCLFSIDVVNYLIWIQREAMYVLLQES